MHAIVRSIVSTVSVASLAVAFAMPANARPLEDGGIATASVPVTQASLEFRGNDYIARNEFFSTANGATFSFNTGFQNGVLVSLTAPNHWFSLEVKAPNGADLAVGSYIGATRYPFAAPNEPGFNLSGDGRGCNQLRAEFKVHRIAIVDHVVQSIDLSFVQHCENLMAFNEGRLVVNYELPERLPVRQAAFALKGGDDFDSGDFVYANNGGTVLVLGRSEVNGNAIFVGVAADRRWYLALAAPTGQALAVGTYTNASKTGSASQPRLSLSAIWYGSCDTEVGSFTIHQLHVADDGSIDLLDLSYHRTCEGIYPATGNVRIGLPTPNPRATATVTGTGKVTHSVRSYLGERTMASISGTVTCTDAHRVIIKGTLTASYLWGTAQGTFQLTLDCTPGSSTPWSAIAHPVTPVQFWAGNASVSLQLTALAPPWQGGTSTATGSVNLTWDAPPPTPTVPPRRF